MVGFMAEHSSDQVVHAVGLWLMTMRPLVMIFSFERQSKLACLHPIHRQPSFEITRGRGCTQLTELVIH